MDTSHLRLKVRGSMAAGLLMLLLTGCQGPSGLYEWGGYEDSVYRVCEQPDGFETQAEIDRLEAVVAKANESERGVPPGLHAYLGYLYYTIGDVDSATAAFESEKELYPESVVFVDGLMKRMGANQ
jgi:hypothetical protein